MLEDYLEILTAAAIRIEGAAVANLPICIANTPPAQDLPCVSSWGIKNRTNMNM